MMPDMPFATIKKTAGFITVITLFLNSPGILAQNSTRYGIDVSVPGKPIRTGHLKLGGTNPSGDLLEVNSRYLTVNNKPIIPVTGEFHYSRYPNQYWDESIKKIKAGGITVLATYVFWNLHEEKEGQFNWREDLDLRRFIKLCNANGLYAIVRIGPFCHGEIRSGGLPDWLMGRPVTIRSNDPAYLAYVRRLYGEIGQQLKGLLYKDGGPVIGIQIENEYQHSAAPWGLTYPGQPYDWTSSERDLAATHQGVSVADGNNPFAALGNDHMMILKSLAIQAGLVVPVYTATGWGYAAIAENESIPVTAAYAYPFWTEGKDLSPFFLYKDMHANPDYSPVRYKSEDYPAFAAELGLGMSGVYTRRPVVNQFSMDALINRCLGGGANGLGYYMYHGGSTPRGQDHFFADEAYGMPKISYDYQAPIGEYGQVREGFNRLKLIHFFLQDYGDILAPMTTVLPSNAAGLSPDNLTDLRYCARVNNGSGFLFINNFQDDAVMPEKSNIRIDVHTNEGDISIPESGDFDLTGSENVIFPFNMNIGGGLLIYATAQLLLTGSQHNQQYLVFFAPKNINPEFVFNNSGTTRISATMGCTIEKRSSGWLIRCKEGEAAEFVLKTSKGSTKILVISKEMALESWPITIGGDRYVLFTNGTPLQSELSVKLLSYGRSKFDISFYPELPEDPVLEGGEINPTAGKSIFSNYSVTLPLIDIKENSYRIGQKKLVVKLPESIPTCLNDIFLRIDYTGDTGMGFLDGELVTDEFYIGKPWEIGLKRFYPKAAGKEMVFYFRPLYKKASFLNDLLPESIPDFEGQESVLEVRNTSLKFEYQCIMKFTSNK